MKVFRIKISTAVERSAEEVFLQFDQKLFDALQPPLPPVRILRFDGSEIGDKVQVRLFTGWKMEVWESVITERTIGEEELMFTDEGVTLPYFLKYWKHRHSVQKASEGSVIVDDIEAGFANAITAALFYPVIYWQFLRRRPVYRRYFRR
jgi:ligand-binding SRPBCC domain-containing protein